MAFWNMTEVCLPGPPINTGRVTIPVKEINNLKEVLVNASAILQNVHLLHVEAAMLSRSMYRKKNVYRTDKGFHKLEKVNRALLQYHAMDFASIYAKFLNTLPETDKPGNPIKLGSLQSGADVYMPTRQMLEWVLVRTQGFARLMCCIAQSCEDASCFWMARVRMGHTYNYSLLILAIISRIWTFSKYLAVHACSWYAELKPYLKALKQVGTPWVPDDYTFPEDLKRWLNFPHITCSQQMSQPDATTLEMNKVFNILGVTGDADGENVSSGELLEDHRFDVAGAIDIGEVISRKELAMESPRTQPSENISEFKKVKSKERKNPYLLLSAKLDASSEIVTGDAKNLEQDFISVPKKKKKRKYEENGVKKQFDTKKSFVETIDNTRTDTSTEKFDNTKKKKKKKKINYEITVPDLPSNDHSSAKLKKLMQIHQRKGKGAAASDTVFVQPHKLLKKKEKKKMKRRKIADCEAVNDKVFVQAHKQLKKKGR